MTSDEIREAFLSFFEEKKHKIIPGSSLVPHGDPTLLLTTAGMVQVKPYFLGLAEPPSRRLASCQKCFRTTDIDSVGDATHLTFFEMLGNFSVGDYFKHEAIDWAWEFVTQRLKLLPERLWVTIYLDDDEAFSCWQQIGFPEDRILRFGEEDNFWGPAGDSGPCGPCSEIHYDFGEEFGCGKPECKPNCECGRFSEIWNLVFTQYNQAPDGKRSPLPRPNIDTGMGLERVTAATQSSPSVYDTDLFIPLIDSICDLVDKEHGKDKAADQAIKVIAEHSRSIVFLIADGVLPSNEGRGYVLRRVLRRASFFGRMLGMCSPFLNRTAEIVIGKMGHVYPEIVANQNHVAEVVRVEEEKFISTLDAGINLVEKAIDDAMSQGKDYLKGEEIFRLYDTYGFPQELTAEITSERGLSVDLEGFEAEMKKQRERARSVQKAASAGDTGNEIAFSGIIIESTDFIGHNELESSSEIIQLIDRDSGISVVSAENGKKVSIVLNKTPFYGEMGGQVGDTGVIITDHGRVDIINAIGVSPAQTVIFGQVVEGSVSVGDSVTANVDVERRLDIARNHTATHLLQAALRQILGGHVCQRGSLVTQDRLRFDFSHLSAVSKQQTDEIQHVVNEMIRQNLLVGSKVIPYKQAIDEGAIALFEEKYGENVRVMKIGEHGKEPVSAELCGGTHVKATGEIGLFYITGESSIGTDLRRIEAVTGREAERLLRERLESLEAIAEELRSSISEAPRKVEALIAELAAERKRSASLEKGLSRNMVEALIGQTEQVNGVTVLAAKLPASSMVALRETGDLLRDRLKSAVIVLGAVYDGKPGFVAMVTPDLLTRGLHAGEIVKRVAGVTGGSGGGKAEMAQAGGRDENKIDEALALVKDLVQKVDGRI